MDYLGLTFKFLYWAVCWWIVCAGVAYIQQSSHPLAGAHLQSKKDKQVFVNNIVSLIHCSVLLLGSTRCLLTQPWTPSQPFAADDLLFLELSMGYFIYDTVEGLRLGLNDIWMNIHHAVIVISYLQAFYFNNCRIDIMFAMFLGELSNPCNILRQNFAFVGRNADSKKLGIWFVAAFIPLRLILCPLAGRWSILNPDLSYILKVNVALMILVGLIWVWKTINLAAKQLSESFPSNTQIVSLYSAIKSMRKYEFLWQAVSVALPCYWMGCSVYADLNGPIS